MGFLRAGHAHVLPLLFLAFCSWIILLAGVSSVQQSCASALGSSLNVDNNRACASVYRFPWWVVWLSFALFVAIAVVVLLGHLERSRVALVGFLAFTGVLLVINTNNFLDAHDGDNSARVTTAFVGFLLTTIFTLALLISIGTVHAGDIDSGAGTGTGVGRHHHHGGATGTTTTTGAKV